MHRSHRHLVVLLLAIGFAVLIPAIVGHAQSPGTTNEDRLAKIQAAFMLNFARFTTWPEQAFTDKDSPLVITVLGNPRLLPYLRSIAVEERVDGRPIRVDQSDYPEPDDEAAALAFKQALIKSHIVYVATADGRHTARVLEAVRGSDVLTVGGARGFVDAGGMLEIRRRFERVTFVANLEAIRATRIRVSSKVLQMAEWVKGEQ